MLLVVWIYFPQSFLITICLLVIFSRSLSALKYRQRNITNNNNNKKISIEVFIKLSIIVYDKMIHALQSKLQTINSTIENNSSTDTYTLKVKGPKPSSSIDSSGASSPLSSLGIIKEKVSNGWLEKKYSEQLDLLIKYFSIKYPSHPDDLISISCKGLLDKLITTPEKSEDIIILSEKGDRIVDLRNIIWKKRRTLTFQFCEIPHKNLCSENEIDQIRKKIRELFALTELHLIEQQT